MSVPATNVIINSTYNSYGPLWNRPTINSVNLCNVPWSGQSMVNAFYGCTALTFVNNMNSNVTNMSGTFRECQRLINVPAIPNGVTDLSYTYYNCAELAVVPSIPSSVTNMAACFSGVLRMIYPPIIPNSVANVTDCFSRCTSLLSAPTLPDGITSLVNTFRNCVSMTTVDSIPNSVTNMANSFNGCANLTYIANIPSNVTNLVGAFDGCTSFTGIVNIDSNVVTDATNIFANTTADKYVKIPFYSTGTVKTATYNAFEAAGYNTTSTLHGVHLLNKEIVYYVLEIAPIPEEANVTLTAPGYTQFDNKIVVPDGTSVEIDVSCDSYEPYYNPGYVVTKDEILEIHLPTEKNYRVDVTGFTYDYNSTSEDLRLLTYTGSATSVVIPEKELV